METYTENALQCVEVKQEPLMLLCRLCALPLDNGISLLDPDNGHLAQWVVAYVNIQIEQRNCPRHICESCSDFINSCIEFVTKCHDSQGVFTISVPSVESGARGSEEMTYSCNGGVSQSNDEAIRPCTEYMLLDPLAFNDSDHMEADYSQSKEFDQGISTLNKGNNVIHYPDMSGNVELGEDLQETYENSQTTQENSMPLFEDIIDIKGEVLLEQDGEYYVDEFTSSQQEFTTDNEHPHPVFSKKEESSFIDIAGHSATVRFNSSDTGVPTCYIPCHVRLNTLYIDPNHKIFHVCSQCDELFTDKATLDQHVTESHVQNTEATYNFVTHAPRLLQQHTEAKPISNEKFECEICKVVVKNELHFKHHMLHVHSNKNFQCSLCSFVTKTNRLMRQHTKRQHVNSNDQWECEICKSMHKHKPSLKQHMLHAHSNQKFQCSQCNFETCGKILLDRHIQNKHVISNENFECDICKTVLKNKISLRGHMLEIHSNQTFQCSQCNFVTHAKRLLREHTKRKHVSNKTCECEICKSVLKSKTGLKRHMIYAHSNKKFQCSHCNFVTRGKILLQRHIRNKHLISNERWQCLICKKELKNLMYFKRHMVNVHSDQSFQCNLCSYVTHSKVFLKQHTKRKHMQNKRFECGLCKSVYKYKVGLNKHMLHAHSNQKFQCSQCKFVTHGKILLKKHIQNKHEISNERWQCLVCKRVLKNLVYLKAHMLNVHCNKTFQCSEGNFVTHSKRLLEQRNKGKDMSNKKWKCDLCKSVYAYKAGLKEHILCTHSSRTFQCSLCSFLTHANSLLQEHKKQHVNSSKQWECEVCKSVYKRKDNLKRHMLHVHSNQKFQCSVCNFVTRAKCLLQQHIERKHVISNTKWECHVCKSLLKSKLRLREHMSYVHSNQKFQCNLCSFVTHTKRLLKSHTSRKHIFVSNKK